MYTRVVLPGLNCLKKVSPICYGSIGDFDRSWDSHLFEKSTIVVGGFVLAVNYFTVLISPTRLFSIYLKTNIERVLQTNETFSMWMSSQRFVWTSSI